MAGQNGKLEVGQVIEFTGENGLKQYAKVTELTPYRVSYKVRKAERGRFSNTPVETTRRAFRTMIG